MTRNFCGSKRGGREKKNERKRRECERLTTSVLAAAEVIVDVGVHHPEVADVVLAMIPTPVAPEMVPLPDNPAGLDKSPTSIRRSLIPRCQPSWPVSRPALFPFRVTSQHFARFFRVAARSLPKCLRVARFPVALRLKKKEKANGFWENQ